jgi:ketosteroid isomerase-like protein
LVGLDPHATFVPSPNNPVTGTQAIRDALRALIHNRVGIKLVPRNIRIVGDVGLVSHTATVTTPDGSAIKLSAALAETSAVLLELVPKYF